MFETLIQELTFKGHRKQFMQKCYVQYKNLNQGKPLNLNLVESFILVPILKRVKLETKLKQNDVKVFKNEFYCIARLYL